MKPTGRLELTWTNKDMRLLSHGAETYEWVEPSDWRVTEVRPLRHVETVGEAGSGNLLVEGDAAHTLDALLRIPELAAKYRGKVKLCYIDPPFNTGQAFTHYNDAVEHSVWLTMLRDRLTQIRNLLRPDGSVWVHLDDAEAHRARCVLDEVFGADNFIATIIWEKADSPRNSARYLSVDQDYIHLYAKNAQLWRPNRLPRTDESDAIYKNPDGDRRGPWLPSDPFANKPYSLGTYEVAGPSGRTFRPPKGKYWRVSLDKLLELDADGQVWWGPNGAARPSIKRYLSEVAALVPRTFWPHTQVGSNRTSSSDMKKLFPGVAGFATPKPERLMKRVLLIGSQPGDLVLDCFAGSGTTAAVAHKMGRSWVTSEVLPENIATFIDPRLTKVINGTDAGGITTTTDWEGGGGFDVARVAPSMFTSDDGHLFLADWATGGALAEAVAAQVSYPIEADGPFAARRGRSRLAVLDGMLTCGVADFLIEQLGVSETLLVIAQTLEPGVDEYLRKTRPGSRARKIPRDLARPSALSGQVVRIRTTHTEATDENAENAENAENEENA